MKLKTGTWVLVADGGHGIIFENDGTAIAPRLKILRDYDEPHARSSELSEDKLSHGGAATAGPRTSHEAPDPHQAREDLFIAQIAHDLGQAAVNKAFTEIIVAASPIALGNFRKAAGSDLTSRVILWIDKDLTKQSVPDITAAITRALEG